MRGQQADRQTGGAADSEETRQEGQEGGVMHASNREHGYSRHLTQSTGMSSLFMLPTLLINENMDGVRMSKVATRIKEREILWTEVEGGRQRKGV